MPVAVKCKMANDQLNHRALPITIKRGILVLLFCVKGVSSIAHHKNNQALDTYQYTCTFEENDHCFLIQDTSDDFNWTFPKTGNTNTLSTGPQSAVEGEAYAYIETNWPRQDGDVAVLFGVVFPLVNPLCLTFAYHMYGDDMGTLNVLVKDETGANIVSWSKSGNQGNLWYGEVIDIQSSVWTSQIIIEGIRGDGHRGDAAIDNVTLTEGSCATDRIPHRCTFEINDQCFLRQETDDDFDWTLPQTGSTRSIRTGPNSAMEGDSYAYIEATLKNNCDVAVLSSDDLTLEIPFCLTFAYHMYGNDMGKLKLLVNDETGLEVITWSKSGDQGDEWINVTIEIPSSVPSSRKRKIVFQGVRGKYYTSDVAVDNIILTPETCVGSIWGVWSIWRPCSQTCGTGTRVRTRTCSIAGDDGIYCSQSNAYTQREYCQTMDCPVTDNTTYKCTFEAGDSCFLTQETLDDFDWTFMQSGETGTSYTGPSSAVEGSSYAYIETNSPRLCCDVAILSSHRLTMAGTFCLSFAYHMYGRNMGTLNVFVRDETGANIVSWSKSGNQGNRWHETGINISSPVPSSRKIIFEGHRKCDITGDVAIDDITLTSGSCDDTDDDQYTLSECPVDGSWATWRTWSSCTVVNKDARRSRCRRCTNPFGQDGNASCSGESLQSEHCPVPVEIFKRKCRCRRRRVSVIKNYTKEELATAMEETKKALTVDKTKTSLSIRKKISAQDDRKSSAAMASVLAVVLLSVPVILIAGIDLMNIRKYLNDFKKKNKRSVRPNGNKVGNDNQSIEMQEKQISRDV